MEADRRACFMAEDARFLIKLAVASTAIALLIKYAGPLIPLPATAGIALTIVLTPIAGVVLWMVWRLQLQR
ncbi:MAG: hypothetical protein ACFB5Z_00085 [Elainellaceae cyanobacterium]